MASPSRRKSGSATRTFLFSSIARTAIWFRQPSRVSPYCASPSSCQLWKNPLVRPWRAGEAETKAAACCNYRTGARRWVLRTGEKGLLAPSAPACPRLNRPRCRPDLALSICPQYALCSSLLDETNSDDLGLSLGDRQSRRWRLSPRGRVILVASVRQGTL